MKRIITFLLTLALVLGTIMPVQVKANEVGLKSLPEVGEVVAGFKTLERGTMDIVNAKTVLFEHEKSGASLMYIQNSDKDRAFDISFKTPALDNTGVNHILEHISVSGSKKYPFKNILFTILNQTYSTFINAFTAPTFTSYPVSSMSEKQLLKLTDVYMDCVFNPSIYDEPKIFEREGWRYGKESESTSLNITGTVYSEMQGSLSNIGTASYYNTLNTLFPDSIIGNVSGGDPAYIPDLTYEQVLKTHDTYYHPSNALIVLYGDLDYEVFLKELDENYLSHYNRKDIPIETGEIAPLTEGVSKNYDYPVSKTSNTKNTSQVNYAYAMTKVETVDSIGMQVIASVLNHEASLIQRAFKEAGIGANLMVSYDNTLPQHVLMFTVTNMDEAKKDDLKAVVDSSLKQMVEKGFDQQIVDAVIASIAFSNANTTEMANIGVNVAMVIAQYWAVNGDMDYLNDFNKNIEIIKEQIDEKYLEKLTEKYILNNQHRALVATVPKAGLLEENTEERAADLQAREEAMTKEEKQKIIDATKAFNEWNAIEVDQKRVEDIQAITIFELPVEVKEYVIKDEIIDDVRYMTAEANVGDTVQTAFLFDTSGIPVEKLHYFKLFADVVGKLNTASYSLEDMNIFKTRYLNGYTSNVTSLPNKNKEGYTPVWMLGFSGLIDDQDEAMKLLGEILFETDFEDTEELLKIVQSMRSNYKTFYMQNPLNVVMMYNLASHNDQINYQTYMGEVPYYTFLGEIEELLTTSKETVASELKAMREMVLNKTNLVVECAGNKKNLENLKNVAQTIVNQLPEKEITKVDYRILPKPAKDTAVVSDTTVNYNMISAPLDRLGITFNGKYIPLVSVLLENYLTPQIRFKNNAYDNGAQISDAGLMMFSYRDPNIQETLDVYKGMSAFAREYVLTQESLDRYIMQNFGAYTAQGGELNGSINAIFEYIQGKTTLEKLKLLEEMKSAKVSDLKEMADILDQLIIEGSWTSGASMETVTKNSDLYEMIITLEEKEEGAAPDYLTKEEMINLLLGPGTFEMAVAQGMINGSGSDMATKEEAISVTDKILELQGLSQLLIADPTIVITDESKVTQDALDAVKRFVGSKVITLDEKGCINPEQHMTEKEVMDMINAVNGFIMSLQPAA